jgi:hypothetical protein
MCDCGEEAKSGDNDPIGFIKNEGGCQGRRRFQFNILAARGFDELTETRRRGEGLSSFEDTNDFPSSAHEQHTDDLSVPPLPDCDEHQVPQADG